MKQSEIETKVGAKIDTENVAVTVRGKTYPAQLVGATLDDELKPVLVYEADSPVAERKPRKAKTEAKPAKK